METFVNDSILIGIKKYLNENAYDNSYIFEEYIIKMLVAIYKEADIINPYKLNNVDHLIDNLCVYGLTELEVRRFFDLLDIYNKWLNSNRKTKNNVFAEICKILIKMIILKSNYIQISDKELKFYDMFFKLSNNNIRSMVEMSCINPGFVSNYWERKKRGFLHRGIFVLEEMKPNYLSEEVYLKFGLNMDEIKKLSYEEVEMINNRIKAEEDITQSGGGRKNEKPMQLVLTSGSGFVDTLVLLSIMCTEIMIGIVITVFLMGR